MTEFSKKPDKILYMELPDIYKADVWLRKNIQEETRESEPDEEGHTSTYVMWVADEVYLRTGLSYEEIESNFDELFENGEKPVVPVELPTLEERVASMEEAVLALMDMGVMI